MTKEYLTKSGYEELRRLEKDGDISREGSLCLNLIDRAVSLLKIIEQDDCVRNAPWRASIQQLLTNYTRRPNP